MIGIVKSSLPEGRALSPHQALDRVVRLGLDGLLFNSLFEISDSLDLAALKAVVDRGREQNIAVSAMLGIINPALPARNEALTDFAGSPEAGVRLLTLRAAEAGFTDLFFIVGMIEDRFDTGVSWTCQLEGVARLLEQVAPDLRRHGARLLIKTHEEITTFEIAALVERIGPDVLGVAYDPVNVLCRLEDPVAAAKRIAGACVQLHLDDAVLRHEACGEIRRYLAPLGEGVVDWEQIRAMFPDCPVWIELHAGQFAMPVFDRNWLAGQADIAVSELARIITLANHFGSRHVTWDQSRPTDRLQHALKGLLA